MHTEEYMWDEDDTTVEITSYENDKIVDTYDNQSEVETDNNHTYTEISEFGLKNAPYPPSTNEWEEFIRELDFDKIAARSAHAKPQKVISAEKLSKVWQIDLE